MPLRLGIVIGWKIMARAPSYRQHFESGSAPTRLTLISDGPAAARRAKRAFSADDSFDIRLLEIGELAQLTPSDILWLELAEAPQDDAVGLLDRIQLHAARQASNCVISAVPEWIDLIAARVISPDVSVLIDPAEMERVAAVGLASADSSSGVREGGQDRSEARLRQLSDEVNRIAMALARLSETPVSEDTMRPVQPGEGPQVSAEVVRSIIRARRLRDQFIPGNLFADPAWDILLDLLQAEIIQHRVPVSSLCIASAVPATTALRWIRTMTERQMLLRREDPHDARRVFIELAPVTSAAVRRYFEKVGSPAVV
jgi:DNA-binding MarR family transcriptional regulator